MQLIKQLDNQPQPIKEQILKVLKRTATKQMQRQENPGNKKPKENFVCQPKYIISKTTIQAGQQTNKFKIVV